MVEYVSHALSDAAKEAAMLLYRETPRMLARPHPRARENQTTLEAYS
jgi:hypothetical protein